MTAGGISVPDKDLEDSEFDQKIRVLTNRVRNHIMCLNILSFIGDEEDEVLRALLLRECEDLLQPPPKSLIYELTSELFP
jgi:hypothetical protein